MAILSCVLELVGQCVELRSTDALSATVSIGKTGLCVKLRSGPVRGFATVLAPALEFTNRLLP
jgi:hypothetical protein